MSFSSLWRPEPEIHLNMPASFRKKVVTVLALANASMARSPNSQIRRLPLELLCLTFEYAVALHIQALTLQIAQQREGEDKGTLNDCLIERAHYYFALRCYPIAVYDCAEANDETLFQLIWRRTPIFSKAVVSTQIEESDDQDGVWRRVQDFISHLSPEYFNAAIQYQTAGQYREAEEAYRTIFQTDSVYSAKHDIQLKLEHVRAIGLFKSVKPPKGKRPPKWLIEAKKPQQNTPSSP